MNNEKGRVKSKSFYWHRGKNDSGFVDENGGSLNFFLQDVCFVDARMVSGDNILVLFYTK